MPNPHPSPSLDTRSVDWYVSRSFITNNSSIFTTCFYSFQRFGPSCLAFCTMERLRRLPPNYVQKKLIVKFLSEHRDLQCGNFSDNLTRKQAQILWQQLADILNNVPNGANKHWDQWRKTWQDMKNTVKKKLYQKKIRASAGIGGPPETLTESEKEIAAFIDFSISKNSENLHPQTVWSVETPKIMCASPTPASNGSDPLLLDSIKQCQSPVPVLEYAEPVPSPYCDDSLIRDAFPPPKRKKSRPFVAKGQWLRKLERASEQIAASLDQKTKSLQEYHTAKLREMRLERLQRKGYQRKKLELLKQKNVMLKNHLVCLREMCAMINKN